MMLRLVSEMPSEAGTAKIGHTLRKCALLSSTAMIVGLLACTGAQAQCADNFNYVAITGNGVSPASGGASVTSLIATMNTVNTAFLTSSTAFVSSQSGPRPGQEGGGVWSRVVGGTVDTTTTSTTTLNVPVPPAVIPATGQEHCRTQTRQDYGGVQFGYDLAKLNISGTGTNFHAGVTGGYFGAKTKDTTPSATFVNGVNVFTSPAGTLEARTNVTFVGLYAAFSQGGFFADAMVRSDFYQNSLSDSGVGISNLDDGAHSISLTGNAGYNIPLGGGWFIEPLGGVILSRLQANSFTLPTFSGLPATPNTVQVDTINSVLGRGGVSVGTNFSSGGVLWQPYASAGVVHEFAGNVGVTQSATVSVTPPPGGVNDNVNFSTSIDRFGTYGQYTLGMAAVLGNTGWLGYGRVDYRKGENIEGVSGNIGLRYQW